MSGSMLWSSNVPPLHQCLTVFPPLLCNLDFAHSPCRLATANCILNNVCKATRFPWELPYSSSLGSYPIGRISDTLPKNAPICRATRLYTLFTTASLLALTASAHVHQAATAPTVTFKPVLLYMHHHTWV